MLDYEIDPETDFIGFCLQKYRELPELPYGTWVARPLKSSEKYGHTWFS